MEGKTFGMKTLSDINKLNKTNDINAFEIGLAMLIFSVPIMIAGIYNAIVSLFSKKTAK